MNRTTSPRKKRQAQKWARKYKRYKIIQKQIREHAQDILESGNFRKSKEHIQHGDMSVKAHVLNVTRHSIALAEALHIKCEKKDLIRGAMLHDYFLYDWHHADKDNPHRLHGFFHPGRALKNARKEYDVTDRQADIIKKHMWPLTPVPPMCREAWVVTAADKYCSLMETIRIHRGHRRQGKAKE